MTADESPTADEAVAAFERLGLTGYEAKVFIALHRLGAGTAREVADTTDVPRSQVYSAAENLESRGLLDVQQSSPIRYRPVGVEEARATLERRFDRERERAFEYVETVKREPLPEETQEDIWTVRDRTRVTDRMVDLLSTATDRVIFGTRLPELVTPEIEAALERCLAEGVTAVVISQSDAVRRRLGEIDGVTTTRPPSHQAGEERSGRIVVVDDHSILLSVVDDDGSETAIWSEDSLFASVLIQLIEATGSDFDPGEESDGMQDD